MVGNLRKANPLNLKPTPCKAWMYASIAGMVIACGELSKNQNLNLLSAIYELMLMTKCSPRNLLVVSRE